MTGLVLRRLEDKGLVACRGFMPGRATRTSVLVWALTDPPAASSRLFDGDSRALRVARAIVRASEALDFAAMGRIWHPEIEVRSCVRRVTRGKAEAAEVTREVIEGCGAQMVPLSARAVDDHVLIDGHITVPGQPHRPATWVWTFRDGLLRRSLTLDGESVTRQG